ncbi:MAG: hypothetical protein ACRDHP_15010 [Ktedonobacterales bacterium]
MFPITPVNDDEDLYRCVWYDEGENRVGLYVTEPDGTVKFSSQVFNDRRQRPSVDRATLCGHEPKHAQKKPSAGVTAVLAGKIRVLGPFDQSAPGKVIEKVIVDVEHKPIKDDPNEPDNLAHAEIFTQPVCSGNVFRKVREALALLANDRGWLIKPGSPPN